MFLNYLLFEFDHKEQMLNLELYLELLFHRIHKGLEWIFVLLYQLIICLNVFVLAVAKSIVLCPFVTVIEPLLLEVDILIVTPGL